MTAPGKVNRYKGKVQKRISLKGASRKTGRYTLGPAAHGLRVVREFVRTTLLPFASVEPYVFDIVSATHEACKNAIFHNLESEGPVDVLCEVREDSVLVEVSDRGKGFDPDILPPKPPDPEALQGRGMYIIYSLMDVVEAKTGSSGTRIRMQKLVKS